MLSMGFYFLGLTDALGDPVTSGNRCVHRISASKHAPPALALATCV